MHVALPGMRLTPLVFKWRRVLHFREISCTLIECCVQISGINANPMRCAVMQEEKIEIIPIRAVFPAFKVLKKHEQTGFGSGVDISGECLLLCAKFGSFQRTADA